VLRAPWSERAHCFWGDRTDRLSWKQTAGRLINSEEGLRAAHLINTCNCTAVITACCCWCCCWTTPGRGAWPNQAQPLSFFRVFINANELYYHVISRCILYYIWKGAHTQGPCSNVKLSHTNMWERRAACAWQRAGQKWDAESLFDAARKEWKRNLTKTLIFQKRCTA
jgi:hypothetical protein